MTFRFACKNGRSQVVATDGTLIDLAEASGGRFSSEPIEAFRRWNEVREFASTLSGGGAPCDQSALDAPSPWPLQVFGIGLNYRSHAEETGAPIPTQPLTFTKFSSSIAGPNADIPIPTPTADWEAELVVVIADGGRDIARDKAWDAVAGIAVGQDISDRALQLATQPPQFSLGKSRKNFSPFGPWLVDARDVADRDAMRLSCTLNGETVQQTVTSDLIFSVPDIVSYLSGIVQLLPGDVIFTGTPSGVGGSRKPPVFLKPGDVLTTTLEGVGTTVNRCVEA